MTYFTSIIKKVFIGLAIIVAAVFITGVIIGVFYGKEVKLYLITQLNKQLRSEVVVKETDISFSVLSHFPNASVEFKNIVFKDAIESVQKDTLLHADKISLLFNLVSLFNKNYTINKIEVQNGQINLRVDEEGGINYKFWKTGADTVPHVRDSKSAAINLQCITLENVAVIYFNKKAHHDYLLTVKDATLEGHFADEQFTLASDGNLFVDHLRIDNFNYVDKKEAKLTLNMKVNSKTNNYQFEKSKLKLAGVLFDIDGNYTGAQFSDLFDLKINADKATLEAFIKVLPPMPQVQHYFEHFNSRGNFACTININGALDKQNTPLIDIDYSVKDGKITPKESSESLKDVTIKGRYYNKSQTGKAVSTLEVNSFTATLGGRNIKADCRLADLSNPFLTLHAAADLSLADVHHFIKLDTLKEIHGDMAFNVSFAGRIKNLPRYNAEALYHVQAGGNVKLTNVSFMLKNNPLEFKNFNGTLTFNNNDVSISDCKGNISSSDFQLDGVFKDLVTFMLIPRQETTINANLVSNKINLDELLANKNPARAGQENDTSYRLELSPYLNCKLNVTVDNVQLRKFRASHIRGQIILANKVLSSNALTFNAMNGTVKMSGNINATRKDSVLMSCNADIHALDIKELFYEMENFGQDVMKDENVRGKITASVQLGSIWSSSLRINPSKVIVESDIKIESGELINFRPILPLAKYIKVTELNHIKFSTLENHISIRSRKISFPDMEIKSSALNLSASGVHDFDNMVDYHLKLLLSDVLGKKVKQQNNSEFGEIEDDGLGHTKLFISMKGPVDNPRFAYDKKAVTQKLAGDFKEGKNDFKSLIKNEFGSKKNESAKAEGVKKKKSELQIDDGKE